MIGIKLSIIIPVLNDAVVLERLIGDIERQSLKDLEIIVADGGSRDDSLALARRKGWCVVSSPPGRGVQMNAAVAVARGEQWLFLHADSRLPDPRFLEEACDFMTRQLALEPRSAGHWAIEFVDIVVQQGRMWRFWQEKSRLDRHECIHGDQGLWITPSFFRETGGFDTTHPFLEERRLAREVARLGRWILLPGRLGTSSRRFIAEGVWRRAILNALIMIAWEVDHHGFLEGSPGLYREQGRTGRLALEMFFRLWTASETGRTYRQRWWRWCAVGAVLRRSVWQIFLLLDVMRRGRGGREDFVFLSFFQRRIEPVLPWLLPEVFAGVCAWFMFHVLRLGFLTIGNDRRKND
ncbi:MAG: glycosyltransferase [Magnetococcales bacterium]|nr:glycosyltransferase [Magnetococcales bacterium]